jgi:hypothetical protein
MVDLKETFEIVMYWVEHFLVKDMIGAFIYLFDHLVYYSVYGKIS